METLKFRIIERIKDKGLLSFEDFMDMALYSPRLGYYMKDKIPIGREGDYYTSPHVHSFLGACVARQIVEIWKAMARPSKFTIVEVGPGAGFLSLDILTSLMAAPLFSALEYKLVEFNPFMQKLQKRRLEKFSSITTWYENLTELRPFNGSVIAHEVIDSFPVRVVENTLKGLFEIYVTEHKGELRETRQPADGKLENYFFHRNVLMPGDYRTEVNFRLQHWLSTIASVLSKGVLLVIDYGYRLHDYYSPKRNQGTLVCYDNHRFCYDPLERIGDQDITCHVNFSDVKKWGAEVGLKTVGFCGQGNFLIALGIDELIERLDKNSHDYVWEMGRIKNLLFDTGQSHYVMIQSKGGDFFSLKGSSVRNQVDNL